MQYLQHDLYIHLKLKPTKCIHISHWCLRLQGAANNKNRCSPPWHWCLHYLPTAPESAQKQLNMSCKVPQSMQKTNTVVRYLQWVYHDVTNWWMFFLLNEYIDDGIGPVYQLMGSNLDSLPHIQSCSYHTPVNYFRIDWEAFFWSDSSTPQSLQQVNNFTPEKWPGPKKEKVDLHFAVGVELLTYTSWFFRMDHLQPGWLSIT